MAALATASAQTLSSHHAGIEVDRLLAAGPAGQAAAAAEQAALAEAQGYQAAPPAAPAPPPPAPGNVSRANATDDGLLGLADTVANITRIAQVKRDSCIQALCQHSAKGLSDHALRHG